MSSPGPAIKTRAATIPARIHRGAESHMSITTPRTTLPPDAATRAFAARTAQTAEDDRRVRAALDGLSERYRSERVRLLGARNDQVLREFAAAHRRMPNPDGSISRPTEEERRA